MANWQKIGNFIKSSFSALYNFGRTTMRREEKDSELIDPVYNFLDRSIYRTLGLFRPQPAAVRYGSGSIVVILVLGLYSAAGSTVTEPILHTLALGIIFIVAWLFGFKAAVFSTVLSLVLTKTIIYDSLENYLDAGVIDVGDVITLSFGFLISFLIASLARVRRRINQTTVELVNITRRAQAHEREVESHKNLLELTLKMMDDAVALQDQNDAFLMLNEAAHSAIKKFTDLTPEQIIGRTNHGVFPPFFADRLRQLSLRSFAKRGNVTETFEVARDGRLRYYQFTKSPFFDEAGEPAGVVTVARDITNAHRLRAKQSSLLKIDQVLSQPSGLEVMLRSLAPILAPTWADWCLVELAVNDEIRSVKLYHHDEKKQPRLEELKNQPNLPFGYSLGLADMSILEEGRFYRRDFDPPEFDGLDLKTLFVLPIKVGDKLSGAITLGLGRSQDPALSESFFNEITARVSWAATRVRLYEEAVEADKAKDQFLALLSHELRNPLAPILSSAEILAERVEAPDSTTREAIQVIDRQALYLSRLLNDLLDVSRVTRGKIVLQRERVDLNEIVGQVGRNFQQPARAAGLELEVSLFDEVLFAEVDPVRVEQIVNNLVDNALKYSRPGGRVTVRTDKKKTSAIISVIDSGPGIKPELKEKIFDLFVQGEEDYHGGRRGLGIGLTMVKVLAEMHGGEVSLKSGDGQGSVFSVSLPLSLRAGQELLDLPPPAKGPTDYSRCRVLVVDDNEDLARSVATLLRGRGCLAQVVGTGADALSKAKDFKPTVVLLDIGLPDMNGYEVAKMFKADPALAGIRLVAVTGFGRREDIDYSKAVGFYTHLTKPVRWSEIEMVLAK